MTFPFIDSLSDEPFENSSVSSGIKGSSYTGKRTTTRLVNDSFTSLVRFPV